VVLDVMSSVRSALSARACQIRAETKGPGCPPPVAIQVSGPSSPASRPFTKRLLCLWTAELSRCSDQGGTQAAPGPASAPGSALSRPAWRTPGHACEDRRSRRLHMSCWPCNAAVLLDLDCQPAGAASRAAPWAVA
jgi:hypothetical protein